MAGRFLFQKLASRMSESTGLLCARASVASARDVAPLTRRASEGGIGALWLFHRSAAHPCTVVPNGHEGSISNLLRGTLATKHSGVHDYAAKYLSPLPCFSPAKMCNPATGRPSHRAKPASVDSVRGVKRTFSSSSSDKGPVDWEDLKATYLAELEADKATLSKADYEAEKAAIIAEVDKCAAGDKASQDDIAAWKKKMNEKTAEFNRFLNILLVGLFAISLLVTYEFRWSPRARRGNKSQAAGGGSAAETN